MFKWSFVRFDWLDLVLVGIFVKKYHIIGLFCEKNGKFSVNYRMELKIKVLKPIFYLIYTSIERSSFNNDELKALLNQCRDFNNRNNITGILLYVRGLQITKSKGRFMQLLEGDERIIRRLFNKIVNDERHESVVLLQIGKYEHRYFTDWSMGFEQTDGELYQSLSGHFDLNDVVAKCDKLGVADVPLQFLQKLSLNNKQQFAEAIYG